MNTIHFEDDILIMDNAFPKDYCPRLISEIERLFSVGAGQYRHEPEMLKNDQSIPLDTYIGKNNEKILNLRPYNLLPYDKEGREFQDVFFHNLQQAYNLYIKKYSVLTEFNLAAKHFKAQKTYPGGGYHIWHYEHAPLPEQVSRVLVYILYLNTIPVENQGDTQFLYKKRSVQPVENRLVVWPAHFTHAHRGNLLMGEEPKYIITGWFHYEG